MKKWKKILLISMFAATALWAVDKTYNDITNQATEATIASDFLIRVDDPTVLSYKILVTDFRDWIQSNLTSLTVSGSPTITGSGTGALVIDGAGQDIDLGDNATDPVHVTDAGLLKVSDDRVVGRYWFGGVIEDPTDADAFLLFKPETAITITDINCISVAGTSVVIDIQECDANGGTCGTVDATITCGTTSSADDGTLTNGAIDANDWIKWDIGNVTGSVTELSVNVWYTVD